MRAYMCARVHLFTYARMHVCMLVDHAPTRRFASAPESGPAAPADVPYRTIACVCWSLRREAPKSKLQPPLSAGMGLTYEEPLAPPPHTPAHLTPPHPPSCVFSHEKFYANVQPDDSLAVCSLSLDEPLLWKSMDPALLRTLTRLPTVALLPPPPDVRVAQVRLSTRIKTTGTYTLTNFALVVVALSTPPTQPLRRSLLSSASCDGSSSSTALRSA